MTRAGLPVVTEAMQQMVRRRLVRLAILSVLLVLAACLVGCWHYEMSNTTADMAPKDQAGGTFQ